jgi:phage-related protein
MISEIVDVFVQLLPALVPLLPPLLQLVAAALELVEPFLKLTVLIVNFITIEALTPIVKLLAIAITGLAEGIEWLAKWIDFIDWGKVGEGIKHVWDNIVGFFKGIGRFFAELPDRLLAGLKALPGLIGKALDLALRAIGIGIGLLIGAFIAFPQLVINAIINFPTDLVRFLTTAWEVISTFFTDHIGQIVVFFAEFPDRMVSGIKNTWHIITDFFSSQWKQLSDKAGEAVGNIIGFFVNLPSRLSSFGSTVGQGILDWLKARINTVINGINDGIKRVDDSLPGISLPRLPTLAHGGIALGPSIIGENPSTAPEAAIPLGDSRAMTMLVNAFQQASVQPGALTNNNNITVVVEIDGQQMNARILSVIDDSNRALKRVVNTRR